MSHRLQVLIAQELDEQVSEAAQRNRISKSEWVRRALREAMLRSTKGHACPDAVAGLAALGGPTGKIDRMLSEIEAGRS